MLRICLCSWLTPVEFRVSAWGASWSWIEVNPLLYDPWTSSVFKTNKKSGTTHIPHIPNLRDWEEAHRKLGSTKKMKSGLFQVHVPVHPEWKREKSALREACWPGLQHPACAWLPQNGILADCKAGHLGNSTQSP